MATLKTNTLTGTSTAGSIAVTGEGNSTTTNLQQGLAKCWGAYNQSSSVGLTDSFNTTSLTDNSAGNATITIANDFSEGDKATLAGSPWRGILNHDDASTGSVVLVHSSTFNSTVDDVNNNTYAIHGDLA